MNRTARLDAKERASKSVSVRVLLFATAIISTGVAQADCFDDAAAYHQVNPWILRAIIAQESNYKPDTLTYNSNRTFDIGAAGINSVHLPELAKHGIRPDDLYDMCTSIYVAGWHLGKMIQRYGNTWIAVGSYHSKTPRHRDRYAAIIRRTIEGWIEKKVIN